MPVFPLSMTVGRRLALAALVPVLLLGLMVGGVWRSLDTIRLESEAELVADEVEMQLHLTGTAIQAARVQLRDVVNAQNLQALEAARSQGAQEMERARGHVQEAQRRRRAAGSGRRWTRRWPCSANTPRCATP
ncbi:hypothetical protein [Teichococcus aestuarii]|uniref:hypothetical protein n=1 Tax=Teichococcus aestuarii TaxID=568898 RepID=UPI003605D8E2